MSRTVIIFLVAMAIFSLGALARELSCTRDNEEYRCGSACQTRCDNINKPCLIVNIVCNDACYCKDGFARNGGDNDPCIPISKCRKSY